jgi:HPt (histidine-containing phosphotransfer) domain-containing protein
MQWKRIALGVMVILCFFTVYQAGALDRDSGNQTRTPGNGAPGHGFNLTGTLDWLEAQGYDLSAIRTAVTRGDTDTARTLLDQFRAEHPDALPERAGKPGCQGLEDADHINRTLERLTQDGYDVSEIQTAVDSGNLDTALKLLRKFMEEHQDELSVSGRAPPGNGGDDADHMTGLLDRLEEQGYDVSAILAAVESGDTDTARTLLDQFRAEHPDVFPGPAGMPGGKGPADADHITGILEQLTEKGYDMSTIQAAVDSGDLETARTLLHQFMEEHRDELPEHGRPADRLPDCR